MPTGGRRQAMDTIQDDHHSEPANTAESNRIGSDNRVINLTTKEANSINNANSRNLNTIMAPYTD